MSENPVANIIQATEERFLSIAPAHMKYDAEKGFAIQILKNNGYLMRAAMESPDSLQQAITNIAAIGLSLNPAEKLAYLIPRNVKIKGDKGQPDKWVTRVYLEPSYMGLIRLATDSGSIKWAQALIVYSNDEYTDNGPGEKPEHKFKAFDKLEKRGDFVGVYCVAKTMDGDYLTTSMTAEEIIGIRDRSEGWKAWIKDKRTCPWVTDFNEQAKKTVIRRAFKTWPRTDERRMAMLANAVELSNQNEGFEPIVTSPEIRDFTADQKAFFDQLITTSDKIGMFTFLTSIDEGVRNNLYHSFEKGSKGKYQRIVDDLYKEGAAAISELVEVVDGHAAASEDWGILENIEGLAADTLAIIRSRLSTEANAIIDQLQKEQENG
jgi:phage RecT family recombinase